MAHTGSACAGNILLCLCVVASLGVAACDLFLDEPDPCVEACRDYECGPAPGCAAGCGGCDPWEECNLNGICVLTTHEDGGDPGPGDVDGGVADEGDPGPGDPGADGADADAGSDPGPFDCDDPDLDCLVSQAGTIVSQGPDGDGDGWGLCCDCDDTDDLVFPFLLEQMDGKDNDCNGLVDEPGGLMVPSPSYPDLWVDVYEVAVFENPDCSGTQYGVVSDDYPPEFPPEGIPTTTLYACSLPGIIPSGHLSWYRARYVCEAHGKRLGDKYEWGSVCNGGGSMEYLYGGRFEAGVCNDPVGGAGRAVETGAFERCVSPIGTCDQSGNLAEWLKNWDDAYDGNAITGGFSWCCELCAWGSNCVACDLENPDFLDAVVGGLNCRTTGGFKESFPRDQVRSYLGTRCCYEP